MGGGEKYRDVHVRETAALQRLVGKPVPDSDGFQERVGRQVRPVFPGSVCRPGAQRVSWTSIFLRPMREKGEW
jgi:hypothetical protein